MGKYTHTWEDKDRVVALTTGSVVDIKLNDESLLKRRALIWGCTGQDGSYLAELLLKEGWIVYGVARRVSVDNTWRLKEARKNKDFKLIEGDVTDFTSVTDAFRVSMPNHIYNLAAQSITEESILPVKLHNEVQHLTFGELWEKYEKNGVRNEDFNGTNIEVIDINSPNIKALGYSNSAGNWYNIKQISRHKWNDKVCRMTQKFGSVTVTPNHSLIDIYGNVCEPKSNPWMLNIRKINTIIKTPIKEIDLKSFGKTRDIKSLCRFIGAFVSEGHTSFNKANGSYIVNISEQSLEWLNGIETALRTFYLNNVWYTNHKKEGFDDVASLEVSSKDLYNLLREECGINSHTKRLPKWFTKLDKECGRVLFETLLEGDGCIDKNNWRYTTSSYILACQLSWLITYLGYEYTVNEEVKDGHSYWHFRNCSFYQMNKGESGKRVEYLDYDGYVYDITVEEVHNFTVGVGNIVVHNSHVGTSFKQPKLTTDITYLGALNILEAARLYQENRGHKIRVYQASSSEMFGENYTMMVESNEPVGCLAYKVDGHEVGDPIFQNSKGEFVFEAQERVEKYQDETTPFFPCSPYGVAKLAAHHLCRVYRKSYGLDVRCGILFNHECFKYDYPIFVKEDGSNHFDILSMEDIALKYTDFVRNGEDKKTGFNLQDLRVWDKGGWTKINCISWFKNNNRSLKIINARNGVQLVSDNHICLNEDYDEIRADELKPGDRLPTISYPQNSSVTILSLEEAELMGMIVGDGSVLHTKQFTNSDESLRKRFAELWANITGGTSSYYPSLSGFTNEVVGRLDLAGGNEWLQKYSFYSEAKSVFGHQYKRIPKEVLNAHVDIMEAFLIGYNACDGLKKSPCKYRFKNFKTNSPVLAAGLLYLVDRVTNQEFNITVEESWEHGKQQFYYSINLLSDDTNSVEKHKIIMKLIHLSTREIYRQTGISRTFISKVKNGYLPQNTHHLRKIENEVKKIIHVNVTNYDDYFFDLETETGTLHAGIGKNLTHNSPRRGDNFVTKKIVKYLADILEYEKEFGGSGPTFELGQLSVYEPQHKPFPKLKLGNCDAMRDWGHAEDYVKGMYKFMQAELDEDDKDLVLGTGETHSVKEFVEAAFDYAGVAHSRFVEYDTEENKRPFDVDYLKARPKRAKELLDWTPRENSFKKLIEEMVDYELRQRGVSRNV